MTAPASTPRLRVIGDGTSTGTRVELPDGTTLPGVTRAAVYLDANTGEVTAHLTVRGVALDVLADAHIYPAPSPAPGALTT